MKQLFLRGIFFLCLLLPAMVVSQTTTSCFEIESILADACDNQNEGLNEMVRFLVGPNPLNTSTLSVNWATTALPFNGICRNSTTASKVAQLNATIQSCGVILEPPGGVIPANARVILFTSAFVDPDLNSFAGLSDTVYAIFQCGSESNGHFANYGNSGNNARNFSMSFGAGCTDAVTYDRSMLVDQQGNNASENGATINFSFSGTPSYVNYGCIAPITPKNPDWTAPTPMCAASGSINLNNLITGTPGGTWSGTGVSGNTFNPTGLQGSYPVTYTLGPVGCQVSETHNIVVQGGGDPSWSDPGTLCSNQGPLDLNTLVTGTPGGIWSGNHISGGIFNTNGASGNFMVTYKVGTGMCESTSSMMIRVSPASDASWTAPSSLCASSSPLSLLPLVTGTAGGTFSGSGVSANVFNPGGLSGVIPVTYSVSGQCGASVTHNIQVIGAADPAWTVPPTLCSTNDPINLNDYISGTPGGTWSGTGVNGNMFNPSGLSGAIPVKYTVGTADCLAELQQNINVVGAVSATWNTPAPICANAAAINLQNLVTGTAGGTFNGPGVSGTTFNPTGLSGQIQISYSVGSGTCSESVVNTITVKPVPPSPAPISGQTSYCSGPVTPLSVSPVSGASVTWYSDASLQTSVGTGTQYTPPAGTATYYVTQSLDGCVSPAASVQIDYTNAPAPPVIADTVRYCDELPMLSATVPAGQTINWYSSPALGTPIATGNQLQVSSNILVYYLTATLNSCEGSPSQVFVKKEGFVSVFITPSESPVFLCKGDRVALNSSVSVGNRWSNGASSQRIEVTQPGIYTVTVEGYCNTATASVTVTDATPEAAFAASPVTGVPPLTVNIIDQSPGGTSTRWYLDGNEVSLNDLKPVDFTEPGVYQIMQIVTGPTGCRDTAIRKITVIDDFVAFEVPSAFSPNGDGINDTFFPAFTGVRDLEGYIFNRWGELVYRFTDPYNSWDGTVKGRMSPDGVYVYFFRGYDVLGRKIEKRGTVTLIVY